MPGGKVDVEKKLDMRKRVGRSPDLTDALAVCLEGARRKGFAIAKLENSENYEPDNTWKFDLALRAKKFRESYALQRT